LGQHTERRGWLTVTLLALLTLAVAGCSGDSTPVARRAPTPTPTLPPTATPRPTNAPTPDGVPCSQVISADMPIVTTVGDLQFSRPRPLFIDGLRQLPDSLTNQPYVVNATGAGYLDAFTLVNVTMYAFVLCNNSATTAHTVGQFSVKLTSFTADANPINVSNYCIQVYARQGMVNHTGCGGAFGGPGVTVAASFVSTGTAVGAVQPALDQNGLQVTALKLQPGYGIMVMVKVAPAAVVGNSTYRMGVGVDGGAPVFAPADSIAVLNAPTVRKWDGTACLTSAMQALIPAATTPPTYYICPQA
jgi:hypothetical protein